MSKHPDQRFELWMTAARQSPDFGLRLLTQLPPAARAEVVRQWSQPTQPTQAPKPGLKKCAAPAIKTFSSAQLEAFARSVGRVG